jgi:hypothetical protein
MVTPNVNVGAAGGPPPGSPPGGLSYDDPVETIKNELLLDKEIRDILAPAFDSVDCLLEEHEEANELEFLSKPKHYCALANTGEVILLHVAKQIIEDPTISPPCLNRVVLPFLKDAAGLFIFTEAQDLSDPYKKLFLYWEGLGPKLRYMSVVLNPQIQQLKATNGEARTEEVKKLLRLEQVIGLLDVMSKLDKEYNIEKIAELADASGDAKAYMKALVEDLELLEEGKKGPTYYSALDLATKDNLLDAARGLVEFCDRSIYPPNDESKRGYTMMGFLISVIYKDTGDQTLIDFIFKYRLITNAAALDELRANN